MPRNELDAFDRLYLGHGLTATWDGSVSILAGAGVGGGTTINWMTCIVAPDRVRAAWAATHGIAGFDDDRGRGRLRRRLGRAGGRPGRRSTGQGRGHPARGGGARAGGRADHPERRRLHGLRLVPVRLSGGLEALRSAGPPRRRLPGRCPDRARRPGRTGRPRGRARGRRGGDGRLGARRPGRPPGASPGPAPVGCGCAPGRSSWRPARCGPRSSWSAPGSAIPSWAGTSGSTRSRWSPAGTPSRSRCGADRSRAPARSPSSSPSRVATATSSSPRRGTRACSPWPCPGRAPTGTPGSWTGSAGAVRSSRSARTAARVGSGPPRPVAPGSTTRLDPTGVATLRHGLGVDGPAGPGGRRPRARRGRHAAALARLDGLRAGWRGTGLRRLPRSPGALRLRPEPGDGLQRPPDGHGPDGRRPADHPCDPDGRVRRAEGGGIPTVPGLYVADASLFPTAIGVNPMLTVMALARRVARTVLAEG